MTLYKVGILSIPKQISLEDDYIYENINVIAEDAEDAVSTAKASSLETWYDIEVEGIEKPKNPPYSIKFTYVEEKESIDIISEQYLKRIDKAEK